jgi:predicted Fe-Mo cluster-binding NifX family protein
MKVCFAVKEFKGLDSEVYGHFGSAPSFALIDTESGNVSEIVNADKEHTHGQCSPIKALGGSDIDGVVVGGIGGGALGKLAALGIDVFKASASTVQDNLTIMNKDGLPKFMPNMTCGGHGGKGTGCSH